MSGQRDGRVRVRRLIDWPFGHVARHRWQADCPCCLGCAPVVLHTHAEAVAWADAHARLLHPRRGMRP